MRIANRLFSRRDKKFSAGGGIPLALQGGAGGRGQRGQSPLLGCYIYLLSLPPHAQLE